MFFPLKVSPAPLTVGEMLRLDVSLSLNYHTTMAPQDCTLQVQCSAHSKYLKKHVLREYMSQKGLYCPKEHLSSQVIENHGN